MSSERRIDPYSILILVISILGVLLILIGPFAGFYLPSFGNRYSCFDCEYTTTGDLIAQIMLLIFLVIQLVLAINNLLPTKFIKIETGKFEILVALLTIVFAIIGIAVFGTVYADFEWWPELGFYSGILTGILNLILVVLRIKLK